MGKEHKELPEKKEVLSGKMQTVYTHGKVFKIPVEKSLKEFLKEKYPEENK